MQRKILKATREKQQLTYKGNDLRLSAYFLAESVQARNQWQDIFKLMKGKKTTTENTLPRKGLIEIQWR